MTKGLGSCLEALHKLRIRGITFPPELKRPVLCFVSSLLKLNEPILCIQDTLSSRAALGLPAVQPLGRVRRASKGILHTSPSSNTIRGRLQRTSGKWGGGGFEISDIPGRGRGWFVKVRTSENI